MTAAPSGSGPNTIWMWRGLAVGAYSRLELELCTLFQALLGTSGKKAGIVFFKITSARARNAIIEGLLKDSYGNNFNLFWNSFLKLLSQTDNERNEIVHWSSRHEHNAEGLLNISLVHPNIWNYQVDGKEITSGDLEGFIKKCNVFTNLVTMFIVFVCYQREGMDKNRTFAWLNIFHKPLAYPLPADHLLFQTALKPDIPPQAFDP